MSTAFAVAAACHYNFSLRVSIPVGGAGAKPSDFVIERIEGENISWRTQPLSRGR
jgi:hypothetical protein